MIRNQLWLTAAVVLGGLISPLASSILPHTPEDQVHAAGAIFEGRVVAVQCYRSATGVLKTRATISVSHTYKGQTPHAVQLSYRGGMLADAAEFDGGSPQLKPGEEHLFFVVRHPDGSLTTLYGSVGACRIPESGKVRLVAPDATTSWRERLRQLTSNGVLPGDNLSDHSVEIGSNAAVAQSAPARLVVSSSVTNMFSGQDKLSSRFLQADRGESIPVYVDDDYLPEGLTREQGLQAVLNALDSWASASSLRFHFAGFESFGAAAGNLTFSDGALRIQLHDHYGLITPGGETLGRGGSRWSMKNVESAGWTLGGNVAGSDFHKSVSGWVVIQHTNASMRNLANLTEVLCHEIGHALSLGHSSERLDEPNPLLKEAMMYYMAHAGGRGASLRSYDTNVISQAYPQKNTPPYCHNRVMEVITTPTPISGLNLLRLAGYDLQGANTTLFTADATSRTGTFTFTNSTVLFEPARFQNGPALDPAGNSYYDFLYYRFSDGVNASPYAMLRVIALQTDSYDEGVPDAWRDTYFGSPAPNGPNRRANQDFDGDGFTNLDEYRLGSDPTSAASNLSASGFDGATLTWDAKPFALYEIHTTSNFADWTCSTTVIPTNSTGSVSIPSSKAATRFFRVEKVR